MGHSRDDSNCLVFEGRTLWHWMLAAYFVLCVVALLHVVQYNTSVSILPEPLLAAFYGWWLAVTTVWILWESGRLTMKCFRFEREFTPFDALLLHISVGLYTVSFLLFCLGLAGHLTLESVILLGVIIGGSLIWRVNEHDRASPRIAVPFGWGAFVVIYVLTLWFLPFVIQASLPNSDWDGALFHIPFAEQLPRHSFLETDPTFVANNYPTSAHLFYAAFLLVGAETAILPFNLILATFIPLFVFKIGSAIENERIGRLGTFMCLTVNVLWEVSITPRIDCILTLAFLALLWFLVTWLKESQKTELLPLMGMMLGLTLGLKFTAIVFWIVTVPVVSFYAFRYRTVSARHFWKGMALTALLTATPWSFIYVRNFVGLGDPIYPHLTKTYVYEIEPGGERLPLEPRLNAIAARPRPASVEGGARGGRRTAGFGSPRSIKAQEPLLFELPRAILLPRQYARKPLHWCGPFVILFFCWPLALRTRGSIVLFCMSLELYVLLSVQTHIVRLILPVLPLFTIAAACVIGRFDEWCAARVRHLSGWIIRLAYVGSLGTLLGIAYQEWRKVETLSAQPYLSGELSRDAWISNVGHNGSKNFARFIEYWNKSVERGDRSDACRMLMIGEGKRHLLRCDAVPDMSWNARPWLVEIAKADGRPDVLLANLRREKIDYLLVNKLFLRMCYAWRLDDAQRAQLEWSVALLDDFVEQYASREFQSDEITLYRLSSERRRGTTRHPTQE